MKRIITVQHPQSVHHTNGMIGSWTDWELTETGKQQAENIAENLRNELSGNKYILYSSDLLRAKQTAEIIAKRFAIESVYRKELRERNLGDAVGNRYSG